MKKIPLTRGLFTIVDDKDFSLVNQYKWCANDGRQGRWYAATSSIKNKYIKMHRLITGAKKGQHVDHKNGNTLDNRRSNLRICTHAQNARNLKHNRNIKKTSKYKGVCWSKAHKKYTAQITFNYKKIHLGMFTCQRKASKAYHAAAKKYFGEFCR